MFVGCNFDYTGFLLGVFSEKCNYSVAITLTDQASAYEKHRRLIIARLAGSFLVFLACDFAYVKSVVDI